MTPASTTPTRTVVLALVIAAQTVSAAFFVADWFGDLVEAGRPVLTWHVSIELLATLSLIVAIAVETQVLVHMLRREAHMTRSLSAAARGLHDLMEELFTAWRLTPAEQDVATFLIKGSDIAEIARLRGSAEGTVKAHLNAIYRKAGVSGRPALVSLLLEDLMAEPLIARARRTGSLTPDEGATGPS